MILRRPLVVLALYVACAPAQAQMSDRRVELQAAFIAAENGQLDLAQAARYSRDPIFPWLQAKVLRNQINSVAPDQVRAALEGLGEQPAGRWLRAAWLDELARREDWPDFRNVYRDSDDLGLRCADLRARMDPGAAPARATVAEGAMPGATSFP